MKKGIGILLAISFVLALSLPVFAQGFRGMDNSVPPPFVIYPSEEADITGKDVLTFKWRTPGSFDIDRVEFKLYKGYVTSDSNLIFKQDVDPFQSCVDVKADLLQDGQTYTVYLRSISQEGYKSDKVFNSFVVIKK
jgi:hypothetical protein